jgi:putative membrane protein
MKSTDLLFVALVAALALACNQPRTGAPNEGGQEAEGIVAEGDGAIANVDVFAAANDFVSRAAVGGMAGIELGQMASQRAQQPEVKGFGEMIVRDHSALSSELRQIASSHRIGLSTQLDEPHRQLRDRLSALRDAGFDGEYMNAMVQSLQDMLSLLQTRGNEVGSDAADEDLNQFAAKARATVQRHLDEAHRIRDSLDAGGTTQGQPSPQ